MHDPDPNIVWATFGILFGLVGSVLLWAAPRECECPECTKHVNERLHKNRRRDYSATSPSQKELQHDYEHKGGGFRDGDPDRYLCSDHKCPRNRP